MEKSETYKGLAIPPGNLTVCQAYNCQAYNCEGLNCDTQCLFGNEKLLKEYLLRKNRKRKLEKINKKYNEKI
jgi:hypothetical protein